MMPVLALGAAIVGGLVVHALNGGPEKSKGSSRRAQPDEAQAAALPQSYIVTPVSGSGPATRAASDVSLVDAVRKFTV